MSNPTSLQAARHYEPNVPTNKLAPPGFNTAPALPVLGHQIATARFLNTSNIQSTTDNQLLVDKLDKLTATVTAQQANLDAILHFKGDPTGRSHLIECVRDCGPGDPTRAALIEQVQMVGEYMGTSGYRIMSEFREKTIYLY